MIYKVVPKEGQKVYNPENMKVLSEEGILIRKVTQYWKNQKNDGDVTITRVTAKQTQKIEKGK